MNNCEAEEIENCIYKKISEIVAKCIEKKIKGRKKWTRRVKNALYELAVEIEHKNFQPWGEGTKGKHCGEWVFDVCWANLKNDVKNKTKFEWCNFDGLFLACEIEWEENNKALLDDFKKLTVADADLRLFIFTCDNEEKSDKQFQFLQESCPGGKNIRYFAITIPNTKCYKKNYILPSRSWIK